MRKLVVTVFIFSVLVSPGFTARPAKAPRVPWWDQQKVRFFWGPWDVWYPTGQPETSGGSVYTLPDEEVLKRVAEAGATVFADRREWNDREELTDQQTAMVARTWNPEATRQLFLRGLRPAHLDRARLAHKYGMRYFGHIHSAYLPDLAEKIGARLAVNKAGKTSREDPQAGGRYVPCPFDEKALEAWLIEPALDMAGTGLVDGCQIDWEMSVSGFSYEAMDSVCYCDDCWGRFLQTRDSQEQVARADRYYGWLEQQGLLRDYLKHQQKRLIALYRRGAERVRAVKPDFIFSAYDGFMPGHTESRWFLEGMARGLNSPKAPFFVIDAGFYYPNHTSPWWDVGSSAFRKLGMKHILGFYTAGVMGTPTMDVGAVQQLYDAAIHHDGYWLWFERQWGPEDHLVFRAADKRLRVTESKVGEFLMRGTPDCTFATVVEQSGNPEFGANIVSRGFHLGERHLAQINNVNTDNAVSALLRFPRLPGDGAWSVTDPMTDLSYSHGEGQAAWTSRDLAKGVWLALEKRAEAWLLLTPQPRQGSATRSRTIGADAPKGHPDRPATPTPLPAGKPAGGAFPLVFSRSGPLGYQMGHEPVLGPSLFMVDAGAGASAEDRQIFALKGNCWSPRLSPDRTRVVFSSYVNGRGQIYVVNAEASVAVGYPGRELSGKPYWVNALPVGPAPLGSFAFKSEGVNLSDNEYCDQSPAWSPDGSRIAFASDRDGDWNIYVMNADGSAPKRVTRSPGVDRNPSWSPDGKRLAFESNRNGDFDICVVGRGGAGERVLVERSGNDLEPLWSPDGSRLAFVANHFGYHRDIMLVDPVTGAGDYPNGLLAARTGGWPYTNVHGICWSPDGRSIAAAFETSQGQAGVFVVPTGLSATPVGAAHVMIGDQFWGSGEGSESGFLELVKAPPLRTRPGGVVHAPFRHLISGGWYMGGDASQRWIVRAFKDIAWSPDGQTIAFRSDMDPSGYDFFYTVPAGGGDAVRLDNTLSPMGVANEPKPLNVPGQQSALPAPAPASVFPEGTRALAEAPEFWMFRTDPDQVGESERWFAAPATEPPWRAISTHDFWDKLLGTRTDPNYIGDGWYAVDMVIPPVRGKKVGLHFGAVDENYTLWINGEYIGDNLSAGTALWDQPVSVEITGKYREGQPNHIVVRVHNTLSAGGIWKPVHVIVEK